MDNKKSSISTLIVGDGIVSPSVQLRIAKRRNVRDNMRSSNRSNTSNYSGYNAKPLPFNAVRYIANQIKTIKEDNYELKSI